MKVAISTDGSKVSPHFGRCPQFTIIEIEGSKLVERKVIENPGHHPGYLPEYLKKLGAGCIVAGGMGTRARELFKQAGIEKVWRQAPGFGLELTKAQHILTDGETDEVLLEMRHGMDSLNCSSGHYNCLL